MSARDALHVMCGQMPARTDLSSPRSYRFATGAIERRNPLPTGRYWVDVFRSKAPSFSTWIERNHESLRVLSTESFPPDEANGYEARDWYLFQVLSPVTWEGPGLPTVAGPEVRSSGDTVQRPPPETYKDYLPTMPSPAAVGLTAAAVGLGLFALVMYLRK